MVLCVKTEFTSIHFVKVSMAKLQIGDTRKTSNGCAVALRVPRKDAGCRQPSNSIAAIDFGTTNCSVAYILPGEMTEQGPNMLPFDGTIYRVPTAILFNKDGVVEAFGVTARKTYRNLEDVERIECAYFEQVKMDLQHDEVLLIYNVRFSKQTLKCCLVERCEFYYYVS